MACEQVLSINPEMNTLWNFRREILAAMYPDGRDDARRTPCEREFRLTQECLGLNPKSYPVRSRSTRGVQCAPRPAAAFFGQAALRTHRTSPCRSPSAQWEARCGLRLGRLPTSTFAQHAGVAPSAVGDGLGRLHVAAPGRPQTDGQAAHDGRAQLPLLDLPSLRRPRRLHTVHRQSHCHSGRHRPVAAAGSGRSLLPDPAPARARGTPDVRALCVHAAAVMCCRSRWSPRCRQRRSSSSPRTRSTPTSPTTRRGTTAPSCCRGGEPGWSAAICTAPCEAATPCAPGCNPISRVQVLRRERRRARAEAARGAAVRARRLPPWP